MTDGQVVVATSPGEIDALSGRLEQLEATSVTARRQTTERVVVTAAFPSESAGREVVATLRGEGRMVVAGPPSAAHAVAWRNRTAPSWFGDGACVCAPWADFDRSAASLVVEIDPGPSFGAGTHPSTGLALDQVASHVNRDSSVLDVGCGTGVLAIAGARLGAGVVEAIDIDEAAVIATRANATLNGVGDLVRASVRPLTAIAGPFDTVVANIHAAVLVELATDLRRLVGRAGTLILSGLSPGQTSVVAAALRPLVVVSATRRDDWVALTLRPASS